VGSSWWPSTGRGRGDSKDRDGRGRGDTDTAQGSLLGAARPVRKRREHSLDGSEGRRVEKLNSLSESFSASCSSTVLRFNRTWLRLRSALYFWESVKLSVRRRPTCSFRSATDAASACAAWREAVRASTSDASWLFSASRPLIFF